MPESKHAPKFVVLDFFRGLLALWVAACHLRGCTLVDFSSLNNPNWFHKKFYFFTGLGGESVICFFVLSGFFVGGSILKKGKGFKFDEYLVLRLNRLWVPLIPNLVLTLIVSLIIDRFYPDVLTGKYQYLWHTGPSPQSIYSHSLVRFLENVFFLQGIVSTEFGVNCVLWSLAYEFWSYMVFPCFFIFFGGRRGLDGRAKKCFIGILGCTMFYFVFKKWFVGFFVWLIGVATFYAASRYSQKPNWILFLGSVAIWLGVLGCGKTLNSQRTILIDYNLIVGLSFAIVCWLSSNLSVSTVIGIGRVFKKSAELFSNISYSLYLNHFLFVLMLASMSYRQTKSQPDLVGMLTFLIQLSLIVAISYGLWFLFERNTYKARDYILKNLSRRGNALKSPQSF
ncbi:MAG: acyltransferase [Deltaproteobacteria bacterium]|nr:acyltransferase [Deltaproteobacteria bacterium]